MANDIKKGTRVGILDGKKKVIYGKVLAVVGKVAKVQWEADGSVQQVKLNTLADATTFSKKTAAGTPTKSKVKEPEPEKKTKGKKEELDADDFPVEVDSFEPSDDDIIDPDTMNHEELDDELEPEADNLDDLDKKGLKAFIIDKELEITGIAKMDEDELRAAIRAAMTPESPEEDKDEEQEPEPVDLSLLDRAQLKAFVSDNELDIVGIARMTDEQLRDAIEEALQGGGEKQDEDTDPFGTPGVQGGDDEEYNTETSSWFATGEEEDTFVEDNKEQRKAFRTWLEKGGVKHITIISPKPLVFKEHSVKIGGKYDTLTCITPMGKRCPICEAGTSRAYVARAFKVIDHTPYKNKDNKTITDSIRLMVFKQNYEFLKEVASAALRGEENINFEGLKFRIKRTTGEKSYATGDIFTFEGRVKLTPEQKAEGTIQKLSEDLAPLTQGALQKKVTFLEERD